MEYSQSMHAVGAILFGLAILHVFSCRSIARFSRRFKQGSIAENIWHFLGEIELVFGLWAGLLVLVWSGLEGSESAIAFVDSLNFTEPLFVFAIMVVAATKPVLDLASRLILRAASWTKLPGGLGLYILTLTLGPLLGSLITEPAAMTVTALLLEKNFFTNGRLSLKARYGTIGLLLVNVSIGGALSNFAAPPILMVAGPWGWDSAFVFSHFGWRASISVVCGTLITALVNRRELSLLKPHTPTSDSAMPMWVSVVHLVFMAFIILLAHHPRMFIPLFLVFLGWAEASKEFQSELKLRESLLVALFLGGLVTLGKLQGSWIQPLMDAASSMNLYFGAMILTAFTDNAALTYLGTLSENLSEQSRYGLVAGALVGGGLTVIANAPNPVGLAILNPYFGSGGVRPGLLLLAALPATLLAAAIFWTGI